MGLTKYLRKFDPRWKDVPVAYTGTLRARAMSMSYATGGMPTPGNIDALAYAIRNIKSDAPIVEIGAFCGLSTNLITFLKRDVGLSNKLFSFDPWVFTGEKEPAAETLTDFSEVTWAEYEAFIRDAYKTRVSFFSKGDVPHGIQGFSDEIFEKWHAAENVTDVFGRDVQLGGPISVAFIDGDHSYEGALRDFKNVDKHLEPGGFILFDDSADGSGWACAQAAREAAAQSNYTLISKNPNYLIRKAG